MSDSEEDKKVLLPFHEMGLDDRILKSIAKLGWVEPTLIQVPGILVYLSSCRTFGWRFGEISLAIVLLKAGTSCHWQPNRQ